MQQIDIAAPDRDDHHAERERHQIEGGEARVLAQHGRAGDEAGSERDREPRGKAAEAHGEQRQAREQIADGRARQDGVAHGVAHQAHAAEHEEHADGRRAEREREAADQRAAHEGELDEGLGDRVDHASSRSGDGSSPRAHTSRLLVERLDQLARLGEIGGREHLGRLAPGDDLASDAEASCGKCART